MDPNLWKLVRIPVLLLSICSWASAGTVFEQPTAWPKNICGCWTSHRGVNSNGSTIQWRAYDEFQFATDTIISGVRWEGAYWDDREGAENPADFETTDWDLGFYTTRVLQDRESPGSRFAREVISAENVTSTFLGEFNVTDWNPDEENIVPVFEFEAQFSQPITLAANEKYWFSPLSRGPDFFPYFMWTVSDPLGKSVQVGNSGRFIRNNNFVFSLIGLDGDFNQDSVLDAQDIDQLVAQIQSGQYDGEFDSNNDGQLNSQDLTNWVHQVKGTWIGDANLDGEFNTGDLVTVFQAGHFEDGIAMNSGWEQGDFNGDQEVDTGDLVAAFQDGGFEKGPRAAAVAVPEPSTCVLAMVATCAIAWRSRRIEKRRERRASGVAWKTSIALFALTAAAMFSKPTVAELISNGDFDALPIGNAPNNDQPVGGWEFYQWVETSNIRNNNGTVTYTDEFVLHEKSMDQVSIVATSSFDPTREGNSLRLRNDQASVQLFHLFDKPIEKAAGETVQVEFEVFVSNSDSERIGTVILAGDHGGGGIFNSWDRGPQIHFDAGTVQAQQCDSAHCGAFSRTPIAEYAGGQWQRFRLDIDLESNTYDAYWGMGEDPLALVGDDLRFRAQLIDHLDRINFAHFNDVGDVLEVGEIYLDNISVTTASQAAAVPEPTTGIVTFACMLGIMHTRRRRFGKASTH